jgi:uncharacterized membrane protein YgcG
VLWIVVIAVGMVVLLLLRPLFTKQGRARLIRSERFNRAIDIIADGLINLVVNVLFGILGAMLGGGSDDKRRSSKSTRQGAFDGGGASGDW